MTFSLNELVSLVQSRLINSFSTLPGSNDWIWTAILLLIFSLIVIPLGFKLNFLKAEIPEISWKVIFRLTLITLLLPATAEEVFFRVLLLPHKTEQASLAYQWIAGSISLVLFVIYHPLNATFFIRNARTTFSSFAFLTSAAILAIVCTIAYLKSGSIYPPVMLHWVFVVSWLLGFGGYQRLNNQSK
ncbi:MAG: CPBP family intramembrane metalloprotease [Komarekiella atlantica HA4396-MV6]|jgi:predicted Abi (CAAX) family protease|nr:CPBP family intramembrane metalloprotease [Komarekiella atlantica HA4396-MV6]